MVAVAVITGSLVVGDSVRNTLVKRVEERLGKTETVVFSRYSFINDSMIDDLSANGMLLSNGFISLSGRLIPVMVWGRDDLGIKEGYAKINSALYNEIKASQPKHVILRLPSAGMVPIGSMFVTDTYTTSLRLEFDSVLSVEEGGNINLKNEQIIPFNIFVHRAELAKAMGVEGKINVALANRVISKDEFAAAWNYTCSGLNIKTENQVTTVTSDRIFIQNSVIDAFCHFERSEKSNRIYAYLANSIRTNSNTIPYSFITAADNYNGQPVQPNEIILSDYAAKRLNAKLNDTISISYFVSRQFKTLVVDSVFLTVGKIVPLQDFQTNNTLKADFPGLSNVARCTDWNSDLPINMNLITEEDESYWTKYKNTPKAIVPYSVLAPRWENGYGSATALQINNKTNRLNDLTFEMFDIQLIYPRQAAITAAKSGINFSMLFLSLGFFIIISAIMLMMVPLSEMLFRRRDELSLLKATGFPRKRILRILLRESAPVVSLSALIGVIAGLIYTSFILFLLGNVWKGATHTEGFRVHLDVVTLFASVFSGIFLSLLLLYTRIVVSISRMKK